MYTLEKNLISGLECEKDDILTSNYPEDRIAELADSYIPVYYSELAQLLASDTSLSEPDDTGVVEGVTDVWKILQASVSERLSAVGYKWLSENELSETIELTEGPIHQIGVKNDHAIR